MSRVHARPSPCRPASPANHWAAWPKLSARKKTQPRVTSRKVRLRCQNGREAPIPRRAGVVADQQQAVPGAPRRERPVGAVPEAAQDHGGHQVEAPARGRAAVAPERDVEVVAQPERQRHVPAAPEVARRHRLVRAVEVLGQLDPEQPPEADRHVGVAAEVEVDLERVAEQAEPRARGVEAGGQRQQRVDQVAEAVRDQHLLAEPHAEEEDALPPARVDAGPGDARELRDELVVARERARHQVREEAHEAGEAHEVALGGGLAAPDVDDVRQRLEGVEADAGREHDLEPAEGPRGALEPQRDQPLLHGADHQARVLEVGEHAQVARERDREEPAARPRPALARDPDRHPVVHHGGEQHGHDEPPVARERVEDHAGQRDPAEQRLAAQVERDDEGEREEEEEELQRAEQHGPHWTRGAAEPSRKTRLRKSSEDSRGPGLPGPGASGAERRRPRRPASPSRPPGGPAGAA